MENVAAEIIALAADFKHLAAMRSSAELCLADAQRLFQCGDFCYAAGRALRSLEYSLGRTDQRWIRAQRAIATAL